MRSTSGSRCCTWTRLSIIRNGILKTPIMFSPRMMTTTPPIFATQSRYSISALPIALAVKPSAMNTSVNPAMNASA